jgi:hypothetical protein
MPLDYLADAGDHHAYGQSASQGDEEQAMEVQWVQAVIADDPTAQRTASPMKVFARRDPRLSPLSPSGINSASSSSPNSPAYSDRTNFSSISIDQAPLLD